MSALRRWPSPTVQRRYITKGRFENPDTEELPSDIAFFVEPKPP